MSAVTLMEFISIGFAGDESLLKAAYASATAQGFAHDKNGDKAYFEWVESTACEAR